MTISCMNSNAIERNVMSNISLSSIFSCLNYLCYLSGFLSGTSKSTETCVTNSIVLRLDAFLHFFLERCSKGSLFISSIFSKNNYSLLFFIFSHNSSFSLMATLIMQSSSYPFIHWELFHECFFYIYFYWRIRILVLSFIEQYTLIQNLTAKYSKY